MSLRPRIETMHIKAPLTGWPVGTTPLVPAQQHSCVAVYSALFGSTANFECYLADTANNPVSSAIFGLASDSTVIPQNNNSDPWWITGRGLGLQIVANSGPVYGDIYWMYVPDYNPPDTVS